MSPVLCTNDKSLDWTEITKSVTRQNATVKKVPTVPKNKKIKPLYYCNFTIPSTSFYRKFIFETFRFENSSFF